MIKRAEIGEILKWILWIIFALIALGGLYYIAKKFG